MGTNENSEAQKRHGARLPFHHHGRGTLGSQVGPEPVGPEEELSFKGSWPGPRSTGRICQCKANKTAYFPLCETSHLPVSGASCPRFVSLALVASPSTLPQSSRRRDADGKPSSFGF